MTKKKQLNIRVDSMTRQHIEDLVEQTGLSKPEVLMLAIDRLWMQEFDIERVPVTIAHDEPDPVLADWRHIKELMKAPDGF